MLGPHIVERLRSGASTGDDDWGNPSPGADEVLTIEGCSVQPGSPGGEYSTAREATSVLYTVWVPGLPDIKHTDRIRYAGRVFDIDGEPERWDFPPMAHTVIRLTATEG